MTGLTKTRSTSANAWTVLRSARLESDQSRGFKDCPPDVSMSRQIRNVRWLGKIEMSGPWYGYEDLGLGIEALDQRCHLPRDGRGMLP
jgi:hypothetical protein